MKVNSRLMVVGSILLSIGLLVAGCGTDEADTTEAGTDTTEAGTDTTEAGTDTTEAGTDTTEIHLGLPDQVPPLDPQKAHNIWLRVATDSIYQQLLNFDDEGTVVPYLAELPERIDETTWRFQIREGIEFTNGEPMDAHAAAFSINRIVDPEFNSEWTALIGTIESAEARSDYELDVITTQSDVLLPKRVALIRIVAPEHAQSPDFPSVPIGTGPYLHVSGDGQGTIVLERRQDEYWGTEYGLSAGTIDRVSIRAIPDLTTRLSALRAGEIDLATALTPDAAAGLEGEDGVRAVAVTGVRNPLVLLNTFHGVTTDRNVRLAMNLAVDKQAIADQLWKGYAEVANCQSVVPSAVGYNPDLEPYPYDPERARQLISDAGAEGGTVEIVTTTIFPNARELAQTLAAYWTEIGLTVEVTVPEFDSYLDALYADGADRAEAVYVSTATDLLEADAASRQIVTDSGQAGSQSAYSNEEVDRLFNEARDTEDTEARGDLYAEALAIACEDAALVSLLHEQDIYGVSERIEFTPRYDAYIYFENIRVVNP